MNTRVLLPVVLVCTLTLAACSSSRPIAHMIINNESGMEIPINLSITNNKKGTTREIINYATIKPGLQELDARKFHKGIYSVMMEANNGLVTVKKNLSLDADRWIMVTYCHDDSLNIQRKYGYVDTSLLKKIDGKYTGLDMYFETRRPSVFDWNLAMAYSR